MKKKKSIVERMMTRKRERNKYEEPGSALRGLIKYGVRSNKHDEENQPNNNDNDNDD